MENINENKEIVTLNNTESLENRVENDCKIVPSVNIAESADSFFIAVDLPGVTRENLKIKIENNQLIVLGKPESAFADDVKYLVTETCHGSYFRAFNLSDEVNREGITASYSNGKLLIELKKNESAKAREIKIL